jgi:hypothetical protein
MAKGYFLGNEKVKNTTCSKVFLATAIIFFSLISASFAGELFNVSVKNISIKKCERIIWFKFEFKNGIVFSFPHIPNDWNIKIGNWDIREQPKWTGSIEGNPQQGGGAVSMNFFKDFAMVEQNEGTSFNCVLTFLITDGDKDRKVKFELNKMSLLPLADSEKKYLAHPDWSWSCK